MKVVFLDDSPIYVSRITEILENVDFDVSSTTCWSEIAALIRKHEPDVIILDVNLGFPGVDGRLIAKTIRNFWPKIPILFLSGVEPEQLAQISGETPRSAFLGKREGMENVLPDALITLVARWKNR